jgi:hypothetical protein
MEGYINYIEKILKSIDDYLATVCSKSVETNQCIVDKLTNANTDKNDQDLSSSFSKVVIDKTIEKYTNNFSTSPIIKKHNERKLKHYKFVNFKRENIDKKLVRSLKLYLRNKSSVYKSSFIDDFLMNKYTTPCIVNKELHFNSINYKYIQWLLSHKEMREALQEFINDELEQFVNLMAKNYGVSDKEDLLCLRAYIYNYSYLY